MRLPPLLPKKLVLGQVVKIYLSICADFSDARQIAPDILFGQV